jgi:hypothetical protein
MGGQRIDDDKYTKMLEAYREQPGNYTRCAARTGNNRATTKKAWEIGWPDRGFRPLKDVIFEEQQAARARLATLREAEIQKLAQQQAGRDQMDRVRAEDDAIQSRVEEARMVRAARHTSIALMASVQQILKGAVKLAQRVEEELSIHQPKDPKSALRLFREIATTTRNAVEAAKLSQAMERSLAGEPEKYIGIQHDVSLSEAASEVEKAQRAMRRIRRKGGIIDVESESVPVEDDYTAAVDTDPDPFGE